MTDQAPKINRTTRLMILTIAAVFWVLGLIAILTKYSPERWTRYGLIPSLFGYDAQLFGVILILLGLAPLLLLCRSKRQATWFGSIWAVTLWTVIFGGIYGHS